MKIVFLGVGDAFDERLPNNSQLVISETKLLVDCGYAIPHQIWGFNDDPDFLDAIYITHAHADHYFGVPSVLMRMYSDKRKKPLKIICQKGVEKKIKDLLRMGFWDVADKIDYPIEFIEVEPDDEIELNDLKLGFAPTKHFIDNLAVSISDDRHRYCYSGDGAFTEETERLYKDADLVIQETFLYDEKKKGHATMKDAIDMAKRMNIKTLALTHINRYFRREKLDALKEEFAKEQIKIIIPEPGDTITL